MTLACLEDARGQHVNSRPVSLQRGRVTVKQGKVKGKCWTTVVNEGPFSEKGQTNIQRVRERTGIQL